MSEVKHDNVLGHLFTRKMLIIFFLSFASGLPILLIGSTLKLWLAREHVDISAIGYFSWVGMAYSLKFLWAPLLDRFTLLKIGRRRSWMLVTQILLGVLIAAMGLLNPQTSLSALAGLAVLVGFLSATQDIAVDAYRREYLTDQELGIGSSINIYGYRVAMLVAGGFGISLVGSGVINLSWNELYYLMGLCMGVGVIATLLAPEPQIEGQPPKSLKDSFVEPLREFLQRDGAWVILAFVFLFKLGDALGGAMLNPFYVEMGYGNAEIGLIAKTFGLASSLVGLFLGGLGAYYLGIYRSLWVFGVLQALSTAAFALVTYTGAQVWALATVVIFEDVSQGMGTASFVAFMGALSNKKYTATQYAVLSSVATLGRNFFSGFSGDMVKHLGWEYFFYTCALIAVPGLLMLGIMNRYQKKSA